jgi:hypothetical protein
MNWDLPLLLGIPLILEPISQRMKFFKIICLLISNTFSVPKNQDEFELPYLYWIPGLHGGPYKDELLITVGALLGLYLCCLLCC